MGKRVLVARALKVVASQVMVRALQVVGRGQVRESLSGTETLSLGRLANPIGMQWRKGGPKVGSTQNLMALAMVVIGGKGWHKAVALVARALEVVASQVVKAKVKVKEKEMGKEMVKEMVKEKVVVVKEMVKALQAVAKAWQAVQVMGTRALVARALQVVASQVMVQALQAVAQAVKVMVALQVVVISPQVKVVIPVRISIRGSDTRQVAKNHLSSQVGKESPPVKLRKALQNSLQPRGLNLGLMLGSNEIWRGP